MTTTYLTRTEVAALATVHLTKAEFDALGEYSTTLPTGTTIGKRWKRAKPWDSKNPTWYLGEYVPGAFPGSVGIKWSHIILLEDFPTAEAVLSLCDA